MKARKEHYELYGEEWKAELMKWTKSDLIDIMIKRNLIKLRSLKQKNSRTNCMEKS